MLDCLPVVHDFIAIGPTSFAGGDAEGKSLYAFKRTQRRRPTGWLARAGGRAGGGQKQ